MSYLPELRSSLISAAERAADAHPVADRRRRPRQRAVPWHAIPTAVGVAVAMAVIVLALTQLRHHHASQSPAAAATTQVPGRQALLDTLGVLRRPQTAADRSPEALRLFSSQVNGGPLPGIPERGLVRRAGTTPWGSPIFLIPVSSRGPSRPGSYSSPSGHLPSAKVERLALTDGSGGTCCASADEIQGSGQDLPEVAARPSGRTRIVQVVPDGVATVTFILPRQPYPSDAKAPIYPRPLPVSAPVRNNVVAVQMPRACCEGDVPQTWRAADGHVIKRLGNQSAAARVATPPQVQPETPPAPFAGRNPSTPNPSSPNPSTPNRVWVTPTTGGPHTTFLLHFRNLLNQATYAFHLSGTHCPTITVPAGAGGGPSDLRGRINTAGVGGGTWCPGTYHLSVSVMANPGARPHKPFGTATFTVHR